MRKGTIHVDQERCKGCSLCTAVCPQHVLHLDLTSLNAKGYHPAQLIETDSQHCTGCALCAVMCPDVCITVLREPVVKRSTRARHASAGEVR
ncbi:MAG: 4Fe-4S dicluster domain-containing protein [Phototrophicaceae bacterium]